MNSFDKVITEALGDLSDCELCDGTGELDEQYEPMPGGGMHGDQLMGQSVWGKKKCPWCKGTGIEPAP